MSCTTLTVFDISMATTQVRDCRTQCTCMACGSHTRISATASDHELGRGHRRQRNAAAPFAVVRAQQRFLKCKKRGASQYMRRPSRFCLHC